MMTGLFIALLVRCLGLSESPQARAVSAPVTRGSTGPYSWGCDMPCQSWYVMTPTGGPIIADSAVHAASLAALLNDEYRRNGCDGGDRRDFNRDGVLNSQDFFDFVAAMPQSP